MITVFFGKHQELWSTTGTLASSQLVKGIYGWEGTDHLNSLVSFNNSVLFYATDGLHGYELWRSDGTGTGTSMLKDINPPIAVPMPGINWILGTGNSGFDLSYSDNLGAFPSPVHIFTGSLKPGSTARSDGYLYFPATALDAPYTAPAAYQLWRTDGTTAGTTQLSPVPGFDPLFGSPDFATVNSATIFMASAVFNGPSQLWKYDNDTGATSLLTASVDDAVFSSITYKNRLFFTGMDSNGFELWSSDGTPGGTALLKNIYAGGSIGGANSSAPSDFSIVNGTLFFSAVDERGRELWKTDGTLASTALVKDINASGDSNPASITNLNGAAIFAASDGSGGMELWRSDGTAGGTARIVDINPLAGSGPDKLTVSGQLLYFTADDGLHGRELWVTNGTAGGTHMVIDLAAGTGSSDPTNLTDIAGTLYFEAGDGSRTNLYRTDGSGAGTVLVASDVDPQASIAFVGADLSLAATSAVKPEGQSGATAYTFTVTRVGDTSTTHSASWAVSGAAVSGADFVGGLVPSGTVTFAVGETSKTITVNVAGDTLVESNEAFTVTLANATGGASIATAAATGTILNDDKARGDHNGDAHSDILLQNVRTGDAYGWQLNGTSLVGHGGVGWTPGADWQAKATGDFNGDGRSGDVLLQNANSGDCYIWELSGTNLVGHGSIGWSPGRDWQAKATGDFNGDGRSDILLQNSGNGACYIWELNGTSLVDSGAVGWVPGASWQAKATGDFNGDGRSDILLQNDGTGDCFIWMMDGKNLITAGAVGWTPGADWKAKDTGDFNADGKSDILLQNAATGDCYIWELNGTNLVGWGSVGWSPGRDWQARGTGDFNGDGRSDIVLQNSGTGDTYVWELNGTNLVGNGAVGWTPGPDWVVHA